MHRFSYIRAKSLTQAIDLLNQPDIHACVLAGGTDILVQLRHSAPTFDLLVDVSQVPELKSIERNGQIVIGAAVTFTELLESPLITKEVPLLAEACSYIGSVQIRNVATIGGNVANAALCADTLPVLTCLDTEAQLVSSHGERRIPISELVTGDHQTMLRQGELIQSLSFPPPSPSSRSAFLRIGRRLAMVISRLSLAAMAETDRHGKVSDIRLSTGSAFPHFRREAQVEAMILGQVPNHELYIAAGQKMVQLFEEESGDRWSAPYKRKALAYLVESALQRVLGDG